MLVIFLRLGAYVKQNIYIFFKLAYDDLCRVDNVYIITDRLIHYLRCHMFICLWSQQLVVYHGSMFNHKTTLAFPCFSDIYYHEFMIASHGSKTIFYMSHVNKDRVGEEITWIVHMRLKIRCIESPI